MAIKRRTTVSPGKLRGNESRTAPSGISKKWKNEVVLMNKIAVAMVLTPLVILAFKASTFGFYSKFTPLTWQIKGENYGVHIDAKRNSGSIDYSLGPHKVTVITSFHCKVPPIYMRVVGDALIHMPLFEEQPRKWVGSFTLPMEGNFQLESNWVGCGNENGMENSIEKNVQYFNFKASGAQKKSEENKTKDDSIPSLFSHGAWVATEKVKAVHPELNVANEYIWANPDTVIRDDTPFSPLEVKEDQSMVLKESVVTDELGFGSFKQLSNYEIVCWIGSKSAEKAWGAFRSVRPQLFPNQRPFKFHYYPATNFITPDTNWEESNLQQQDPYHSFRKCKHILISFDEPDPKPETENALSQREYRDEVVTFINHLLNAFNDENTFPALIWMLTVNESPIHSQTCHTPYLKMSTNHPCNDALKDIFLDSPFPSRVRLLDNTDLSAPVWGVGSSDIWAAIALRTYILVGDQVKIWRDADMSGGIDGLTQNGETKPNFELVRYDWTQVLLNNEKKSA